MSGGLAPITTPLGEMFMFTIEGGDLTAAERRSLLDWVIRPALRTLPGVADVNSLGGVVRAFEIVPDNAALQGRGIRVSDLQQALEANNRNDGAGRLKDGEETLLVRVEGSVRTVDDIKAIVVAERQGIPVRVGDVATVRIGGLTRYGAVTRNGEGEAVQGLVLGLRGANAQQVVEGVRAKLAELAPQLPPGVKVEVFYDRGNLVQRAVGTVSKALAEAIVLVVLLLLLFLGNVRAAVVVAATLPLAALFTFILMDLIGMSANLMSLGGLAIAIGMLVDAAVVVVENIVSHLARDRTNLPRLHIIYRAVREVTLPVASGIAIIVIVFLPLLTLQGLEGKLFKPVALTIVFALSGSLVLSLTVIPVLASFLIGQPAHDDPWLVRKATALYMPLLDWSLRHANKVIAVALASLVLAAGAYLLTGKTFMPTMDEGDVIMQLEKLPSVSLDQSATTDLQDSAGDPGARARGARHRRPRRRRRARARPDGAESNGYVHGAEAAVGMARIGQGVARRRVAQGDGRVSGDRLHVHAADRDAGGGDVDRCARRPRGEDLRPRPRDAEPPRAGDRGDTESGARCRGRGDHQERGGAVPQGGGGPLPGGAPRTLGRGHPEPPAERGRGAPGRDRDRGRATHTGAAARSRGDARRAGGVPGPFHPARAGRVDSAFHGGAARAGGRSGEGGSRECSPLCGGSGERRRPRPRGFRRRGEGSRRRKGEARPRVIRSRGAASSRTSNAPPRASPWWCRWRSASSSCCSSRRSDRCGRQRSSSRTFRSRSWAASSRFGLPDST